MIAQIPTREDGYTRFLNFVNSVEVCDHRSYRVPAMYFVFAVGRMTSITLSRSTTGRSTTANSIRSNTNADSQNQSINPSLSFIS